MTAMLQLQETDDPRSLRSRLTRAVLQMSEQREHLEEMFVAEAQKIRGALGAEIARVGDQDEIVRLWGAKGPLNTATNELQTIAGMLRQLDDDLRLLQEVHRGRV